MSHIRTYRSLCLALPGKGWRLIRELIAQYLADNVGGETEHRAKFQCSRFCLICWGRRYDITVCPAYSNDLIFHIAFMHSKVYKEWLPHRHLRRRGQRFTNIVEVGRVEVILTASEFRQYTFPIRPPGIASDGNTVHTLVNVRIVCVEPAANWTPSLDEVAARERLVEDVLRDARREYDRHGPAWRHRAWLPSVDNGFCY